MTASPSPTEIVTRFLNAIAEGRWAEMADFYAEDAVVEQPMNVPDRLRLNGREALRHHFAQAADGPFDITPHSVVIHTTGDPEVVIVEYEYDLRYRPTARLSTVANIQVFRIRDGEIVATRDYHDHLRFAAVAGRAGQLAATLA
jgi:ketosteroid isomerase-like protein